MATYAKQLKVLYWYEKSDSFLHQDYKNLVNCKCLPMKFITCQIFKKKHNFNKLLIESLQKMLEEKLCF